MKKSLLLAIILALGATSAPATAPPATAPPIVPETPTAATAATAAPTAATAAKPSTAEVDIDTGAGAHDRVVTGEDVEIKAGEVVDGDVVVTGGDLKVDGTIAGDAVVTGGDLTLGPTGVVEGDAVVTGGTIDAAPTSKIGGQKIVIGGPGLKGLRWLRFGKEAWAPLGAVLQLVKEVAFFGVLLFVALLLVIFLPRQFARVEEHLAHDFPRSALLGVAAMILLPVSLVLLCVTIIGIPFAPLVFLAAVLSALVGYVTLGKVIGARLLKDKPAFLQTLVGLLILQAAAILGDLIALPGGAFEDVGSVFRTIGGIIFLGGAFIGMGAVFYSRFGGWTLARSQAAFRKNGGGAQTNAGVPPATPAIT